MDNRIIYSQNGTLSDKSVDLNNYHSAATNITLSTNDFLYLGSRLPFNHFYLKISDDNEVDLSLSASYWDGEEWVDMVDLLDETNGLTQSGHIQFTPNRRYGWCMEPTNEDGNRITGLTDVVIYDLYWMRISVSQTADQIGFEWVGNIFCSDDDLYSEFPDFRKTNVLTAFEENKTDWEEQRVIASRMIVKELISKNVIEDKGQVLDWRMFRDACVMKTAELIFKSFGDDYIDDRIASRNEFNDRMSRLNYRVDKNKNAIEDFQEMKVSSGYFSR